MARVDLNADLGEGCGDDAALLDIVSSANIACGAHAGDTATMARTVAEAVARGVAVGAHVSYPDRPNFGRRETNAPPHTIAADVLAQLGALDSVARGAGRRV